MQQRRTPPLGGEAKHLATENTAKSKAKRFGVWSTFWLVSSACPACGSPPNAETPTESPSESDVRGASSTSPSVELTDGQLVEKLGNPNTRSGAVDELSRRYAAVARNGTKTDAALAFAGAYAGAASSAYVDAGEELSEEQRLALIKTLVAMAHPDTGPAIAHAITRYTKTGAGVEEAILATQAAQRLDSAKIRSALFEAYTTLDTSNADGLRYSRHLAAAMSAQRDDGWNPALAAELDNPIARPARFDDKPAVKAFQSGLFRQTIAARLLGESDSVSAAVPLLRVLIDADKAEVHPTAEMAVIKSKTHVLPPILELLSGEGELVEATRTARKDERQPHVYFATKWLDLLRHPNTEQALLTAWRNTKDPVARTLLVRSLSRLPGATAGIEELKATYVQTDIKVTLPEGESALETLSDAAVQFFDPGVASWLEDRVGRVPTVWTRRGDVQVALVMAMSRLVPADGVKATSATAQRYGGKPGTPAFETAARLAESCKADAMCYVKTIPNAATPFAAQKAITMAGCYGDATTRDALVELAFAEDDQERLNQLLVVVEHLTGDDAGPLAAKLSERSKPELESASPGWARGKRSAFAQTIARLAAR